MNDFNTELLRRLDRKITVCGVSDSTYPNGMKRTLSNRVIHLFNAGLVYALVTALLPTADAGASDKKTSKTSEEYRIQLEWGDCQKGYYELLEQRQQLVRRMEDKKKNPCKTGSKVKAKKIECPDDRTFSELPKDLRSQIDALMVGDSDNYPFKDDLPVSKIYPKVVEHINRMIKLKCERIEEFDESSL